MSFPATDPVHDPGSLDDSISNMSLEAHPNMSVTQSRAGVIPTVEHELSGVPDSSNANRVNPPPDLRNLRDKRSTSARFESGARITPVIPIARESKASGKFNVLTVHPPRAISMQPLGQGNSMDRNASSQTRSPQQLSSDPSLFERIYPDGSQPCAAFQRCGFDRNVQLPAGGPRATTEGPMVQRAACPNVITGAGNLPTDPIDLASSPPESEYIPASAQIHGGQKVGGQQQTPPTAYRLVNCSDAGYSPFVLDPGHQKHLNENVRPQRGALSSPGPRGVSKPRDGQAPSQADLQQSLATRLSVSQDFALVNQGRVSAHHHAVDQSIVSTEAMTGLAVGGSYASNTQTLNRRSSRGPPPGLPIPDGLARSWLEGGELAIDERLIPKDNALVVTVGGQQSENQQSLHTTRTAPNPDVLNEEYVMDCGSDQTRKPMFGFSSTMEAENFECPPVPRRHSHGLPTTKDQSTQLHDQGPGVLSPARRPIKFGFGSMAEAMSFGLEQETPAVPARAFGGSLAENQVKSESAIRGFPVFEAVDGNFEQTPASQAWRDFAPHSAMLSDYQWGSGSGQTQHVFGGPPNRLESNETQVPITYPSGPPNRLESNKTPPPFIFADTKNSFDGMGFGIPAGPPEQKDLKSMGLKTLTDQQVLFIFHVLSVMGNLRPEFEVQRGAKNKNKEKFGVKLRMWGHTVASGNCFESPAPARVAACRQGLKLIQEDHPEWVLPPLPSDGPTSPAWDWNWMLDDYCMMRAWSPPLYRPSRCQSLWHCDISVNGRYFRTVEACHSLEEAQNTVAHTSLFQLTAKDCHDPLRHSNYNLPVNGPTPLLSADIQKQIAGLLKSGKSCLPKKPVPVNPQNGRVGKNVPPAAQKSGGSQCKSTRGKRKAKQPPPRGQRHPAQPPQVANTANKQPPKANKEPLTANTEPLKRNRLAPLQIAEEVPEDPMETLNGIEKEFKTISSRTSFLRVLEKICGVMKINCPTILFRENTESGYPCAMEVLAEFDNSHPYLNRASPIMLATVENSDKEVADGIATKHIILRLLKMIKEDAFIDDRMYRNKCPALSAFESETKQNLSSQSVPSGTLSY